MTIVSLIERLTNATGPDHAIDCSIRAALGYRDTHIGLAYTRSVDAALTLLPEGLAWQCGCEIDFTPVSRVWGHDIHFDEFAATPTIALLIAIMKARAALRAREAGEK